MTDEQGRPLTYWGGKPDEPSTGPDILTGVPKKVLATGEVKFKTKPSTEQVPSGLTEGEHLSPQPVPTAGSTAWSEPKQASPNGPVSRIGTSTGIAWPTPRTDAEEYDPFPSEKDPDGSVVPSEFARKLESEIDRLRAALDDLALGNLKAQHAGSLLIRELRAEIIKRGKDCAVSITGDPDDAAELTTVEGAFAAIDGALRLGIERNNEANDLRAELAEERAKRRLAESHLDEAKCKAQFQSAQITSISDAFSAMKGRAETAERQLADLRDRIISITESVPIPAPPLQVKYHEDYLTGATAYRHALREAIFAVLRG